MAIGSQGKNERQFDDLKMIEIVPEPGPPVATRLPMRSETELIPEPDVVTKYI